MALALADRVLTVAITATLTSAAWIIALSGAEQRAHRGSPAADEPVARTAPATDGAPSLLVPVHGVAADRLEDSFTAARGGARPHEAIDIPAAAGTPVIAAAAGTIEKLFASVDGGNTIYVRLPDRRTIHYYAHLQAYAPGLREGQRVARGQRLGTVGSSGNADPAAPHLHFAIWRVRPQDQWWTPGLPVNPYPLLRSGR